MSPKPRKFDRFQTAAWLVAIFVLVGIAAMLGVLWHAQDDEEKRVLAETERRAVQLNSALANRMAAFVSSVDYSMHRLRLEYVRGRSEFESMARSYATFFPEGTSIRILASDARGDVTFTTIEDRAAVNIANREYFRTHQGDKDELFINEPLVGRVSNQWIVQFSRRLVRDGNFDGVLVVSIAPIYLSKILASLELTEHDSLAMFNVHGAYFARNRGIDELLGKRLSPPRPFMLPSSAEKGVFRTIAYFDTADRMFAWEKLKGTDLVVSVGLDMTAILGPMKSHFRNEWITAGVIALMMLGLGSLIFALLRRLARDQRAVVESEERFRRLTEMSSDWYWEIDNEFRLTYVSRITRNPITGVVESLLGKRRWELGSRVPITESWESHRAKLEARQPFRDFEYVRTAEGVNHQYASLTGVPRFDAEGQFLGYHGIGTDISVRKRAEESLRLRDSRLSGLIDSAMDAIISINDAYEIVLFNPAAEKMFGYSKEGTLGRGVDMLIPMASRERHKKFVSDYKNSGVTNRRMGELGEVAGLRADGTQFPIEASISQVQDHGIPTFTVILRDISTRRLAEEAQQRLLEQLHQAQKMESLGTLAGGIAHDFNNILAAILGNVELARLDIGRDHPAREFVNEIERASQRARDLVRQILAFSRQNPVHPRAVDLREIAADAVRLLRASLPARIELISKFANDLPNVFADPTQMHQIIMNLGTNAFHAIGDKTGWIEFCIESEKVNGGAIRVDIPPGLYVRLSITDTGCGMDPATVEKIFDPFFTTKAPGEGTGLGLSVVSGIVKGHGGTISVDSEPGNGSTFHIFLPASTKPEDALPAAVTPIPQGKGQRIIYLDDEAPLVTLASRLLSRLGYQVWPFTQPDQALSALRRQPDAYDMVISDQNMPGISGLEFAAQVLQLRPDIPVALASGYVTDELRAKASAIGVREVLYKPVSVENLAETINRLFENDAVNRNG